MATTPPAVGAATAAIRPIRPDLGWWRWQSIGMTAAAAIRPWTVAMTWTAIDWDDGGGKTAAIQKNPNQPRTYDRMHGERSDTDADGHLII